MSFVDVGTWQGKVFNGEWVAGSGGTYDAVEPATGKTLAQVGTATEEDVDAAARRAAEAQREWAALSYDRRAAVLRRAGQLFVEHEDEINEWLVRESGATRPFAGFQTRAVAAEECWEAAGLAAQPYGQLLRSSQPRMSMARRRPVGVVGVIAPFNAPIILAVRAIAPALALGNAVVLKPDPRTAISGGVVFARIFEEAGLPAGLLQVLPGGGEVGASLVDHPQVPVIAFTGSTRAGRTIARAAADRLKRVHLELGGNSAMLVLDDVDVERAVSVGAFGSFNHTGQICMATSRHLVDARIAEDYAQALAEHADRLTVGDPHREDVAVGPIIDEGQRDNVHRVVTGSVSAGARVRAGGDYDGLFYRPTVLSDVPLDAPAYAEEIFGPVAPVVPFHDLDEAVRLASGTEYGLSLGVLTRDVAKGLELADRIPSGLVHINDQTVNDEAVAPFGGVGDSGNGARHGGAEANLEAFTETQWVTVRGELPAYPF
ncbi:aldehyde dehydrogenase family protein [Saccharopolyspora rhizosphaerae]|uniref:Aldehyde dehydrogenase family protein n=1 Tax=Saccharopolyspora rhizosphaerae TaxID=2492662 RepID=A0A3R8Q1N7_9PSEU|nr:benzaldehyde dehydrogenase [Saccharopolyspora rhizosphaerae]RRO16640.1 aldehyde dehydrogenase family protein [Saccharopolyspora rhizosphaerae]